MEVNKITYSETWTLFWDWFASHQASGSNTRDFGVTKECIFVNNFCLPTNFTNFAQTSHELCSQLLVSFFSIFDLTHCILHIVLTHCILLITPKKCILNIAAYTFHLVNFILHIELLFTNYTLHIASYTSHLTLSYTLHLMYCNLHIASYKLPITYTHPLSPCSWGITLLTR